jgi:serine/threonine protein kinase
MLTTEEAPKQCPQCETDLRQVETRELTFCQNCRFPLLVIAGKYRLKRILGEGTTAVVYLATHIHLQEENERVIKIVKPETLNDDQGHLRFQREIQVTTALSRRNEHIVSIYDDFGELPELGCYYVMEYLKGKALQDLMYAGQPLGKWLTFRVFYQLCQAMGAAHRAGIVHRDLKPENILLVERDIEPYFLKLIDFGIAKPIRRKADLIMTQGALGTPAYMSPEQCLNRPVDSRSDIYAMGALLYECLTGEQPFSSKQEVEEGHRVNMLEVLKAHINDKPPSMLLLRPDLPIPEGLDKVVLKTLEKDPDMRYQRVEDLWDALAPFAPPVYQQLEMASQTGLPAAKLTPPTTNPKEATQTRPQRATSSTEPSAQSTAETTLEGDAPPHIPQKPVFQTKSTISTAPMPMLSAAESNAQLPASRSSDNLAQVTDAAPSFPPPPGSKTAPTFPPPPGSASRELVASYRSSSSFPATKATPEEPSPRQTMMFASPDSQRVQTESHTKEHLVRPPTSPSGTHTLAGPSLPTAPAGPAIATARPQRTPKRPHTLAQDIPIIDAAGIPVKASSENSDPLELPLPGPAKGSLRNPALKQKAAAQDTMIQDFASMIGDEEDDEHTDVTGKSNKPSRDTQPEARPSPFTTSPTSGKQPILKRKRRKGSADTLEQFFQQDEKAHDDPTKTQTDKPIDAPRQVPWFKPPK